MKGNMLRRMGLLFLSLVLIVLALSACSGSGSNAQAGSDSKVSASPGDDHDNDSDQTEGTAPGSTADAITTADNVLNIEAVNFNFGAKTFIAQSGKDLKIQFKSKEGVHGFAIDDLAVNITGNGEATIPADKLKPGSYAIYCSVFCGSGHSNMKATLLVK